MKASRNLAVIHYSNEEHEQVLSMQKRIRQALARGHNVALLCEVPMVHRMQRLVFACLSAYEAPGRFAVVTHNPDQFSAAIPTVLSNRLQVFESEIAAFAWLDPNPLDPDSTVLELATC